MQHYFYNRGLGKDRGNKLLLRNIRISWLPQKNKLDWIFDLIAQVSVKERHSKFLACISVSEFLQGLVRVLRSFGYQASVEDV